MTLTGFKPFAHALVRGQVNPTAKSGRITVVFPRSIKQGWSALMQLRHNVRSRRQLAALGDHLLADIGLTEAQRQAEISKPFWKR